MTIKKTNCRIVDIFSGGGGLSQGFLEAGFEIVSAFDNWDPAIDFYARNFEHPIIKCDLGDISKSVSIIRESNPTLIIGGPPCQDFSSAGKRDENGGRANLTISFANIISELMPTFFVMENVERAIKSNAFRDACEIFRKAEYGLTTRVLDASRCGVPQIRKRVFVIGEYGGRDGFLNGLLDKYQSTKPMTVREYFGDSLGIQFYYRHPRSYQRRAIFSIDEPSPTVRGVNRPVPGGYPGHPGDRIEVSDQIRPLTTRERAMIQTFPDWFDLSGNKTDVEQIIGNAVPVKLAKYVADSLSIYFEDGPHDGYLF